MTIIDKIKRLRRQVPVICGILEMIIAVLVLIGLILSLIGMFRERNMFQDLINGEMDFMTYMETIFTLVIGIEFMEMLCRPNAANVMEVLIFLVARHMILEHGTVYADFVSVLSICILCVVRRMLRYNKERHDEEHHIIDQTKTLDN